MGSPAKCSARHDGGNFASGSFLKFFDGARLGGLVAY